MLNYQRVIWIAISISEYSLDLNRETRGRQCSARKNIVWPLVHEVINHQKDGVWKSWTWRWSTTDRIHGAAILMVLPCIPSIYPSTIFFKQSPTKTCWLVVRNMFYFPQKLGWWSNLTNIFQGDWNRQLAWVYPSVNKIDVENTCWDHYPRETMGFPHLFARLSQGTKRSGIPPWKSILWMGIKPHFGCHQHLVPSTPGSSWGSG